MEATGIKSAAAAGQVPKPQPAATRVPLGSDVPVLDARPGGPAERYAQMLDGRRPVLVFLSALIAGYVALTAVAVGLGFLLTKLVLSVGSISRADNHVETWLVAHRSPGRTEASLIGSILAGGVVLPIVVGVTLVVFAVLRRWRIAVFILAALLVESATYKVTTIFVHRHRPQVPRLESLDVNASYPSGHTAASIAVYVGLVLLVTSRVKNRSFRVVCWTIAVAIPPFVAVARLYRGMHHPLDVVAGGLIGIAALIVVVFAERAAGVAAERRQPHAETDRA